MNICRLPINPPPRCAAPARAYALLGVGSRPPARWPASCAMTGSSLASPWLLAFMFCYSIALGALFFVMLPHLTGAGWSVGIRRFCEHLAALLFPSLALLFVPVGLMGPRIYSWMRLSAATNNLVAAKQPVFTLPGFWITSAVFFGIWWLLSSRLLALSLEQDKTGSAECTRKMRFYSGWGVVAFALTLTYSRRAVDAGRAIPVVFGHLWRLFLCQQRLGGAGGDLRHFRGHAAAGDFDPGVEVELFLFHRRAAAGFHAALGLHRVCAILCGLECQHARGDVLVSHARTGPGGGG